jgi:hypothetical protein
MACAKRKHEGLVGVGGDVNPNQAIHDTPLSTNLERIQLFFTIRHCLVAIVWRRPQWEHWRIEASGKGGITGNSQG